MVQYTANTMNSVTGSVANNRIRETFYSKKIKGIHFY